MKLKRFSSKQSIQSKKTGDKKPVFFIQQG